jgi:hypothetical protein
MSRERAAIPLNPNIPIRWGFFSGSDRDLLDLEFRALYAEEELGLRRGVRSGYLFGAALEDFDDLANVFGLRSVNVYEQRDSESADRHLKVRLPLILRHLTQPMVREHLRGLRRVFLQNGVGTEEAYLAFRESYWEAREEVSSLVRGNAVLRGNREFFIGLRFNQEERYAAFVDRKIAVLDLKR